MTDGRVLFIRVVENLICSMHSFHFCIMWSAVLDVFLCDTLSVSFWPQLCCLHCFADFVCSGKLLAIVYIVSFLIILILSLLYTLEAIFFEQGVSITTEFLRSRFAFGRLLFQISTQRPASTIVQGFSSTSI